MAVKAGLSEVASLKANRFQTVGTVGLDLVSAALNADLEAWNANMGYALQELCDVTSDKQRLYGTSSTMEMEDATEYTQATTQRTATGYLVGFPMSLAVIGLGWTTRYLMNATPADLFDQQLAAQAAHRKRIYRDIRRAVFGNSNYDFTETLTAPQFTLKVKRFINADSADIPDGPNGEVFTPASHQHYVGYASGSWAVADSIGLINTVVEHGHGARVILAINVAQEATVAAYTGFVALQRVEIRPAYTADSAIGPALDISRINNRQIGYLGAAEVWTKPWVPANYQCAYDVSDPRKPLVCRTRNGGAPGLNRVASVSSHPLASDYYETEAGFGVWTRTNGAVGYMSSNTYTAPTIS